MIYVKHPVRTRLRHELGLDGPSRPEDDAIPLDAPITEDGDMTQLDLLADDFLPDLAELAAKADMRRIVRASVKRLPPRQGEVVRRWWFEGQTFEVAAAADGTSPQNAARLEKEGFRRLRRDARLLKLLDEYTNYYKPGGLREFRCTWSSSVEQAVMLGERCLS